MDVSLVSVKTFRDREAIFSVSLSDGTSIPGKVTTITESFDGTIHALNMLTMEGETLVVPMSAVLSVDKYLSDDPQDYRHFMKHIDDSNEFWRFELVSGKTINARVLYYFAGTYGTPITLLLRTEDDETFEVPWSAILKIR